MPDTILRDEEAMERRARSWAADLMRERLQPPPDLTVSEWADQHRKLPETAAEPGPWRTSRAPYLREIMDAFSDEKVRRVVFMKGVQLGGSEVLLNTIGYFIDQDPAPILYVQVSAGDAQNFSKERIAPMIRECPVLREKVAPPKSRDSGNTIDSKALALDTPLPAPSGWTTMGEVDVGDRVFAADGTPCNVTDTTEVMTGRPCYRIEFSDGEEIVADATHGWPVEWWKIVNGKQRRVSEVLPTRKIAERVELSKRYKYSIPLASPLDLPGKDLPVPPYVLGAWLGDGLSHRPAIVNGKDDAAEIRAVIEEVGVEVAQRDYAEGRTDLLSLDPDSIRRNDQGRYERVPGTVLDGMRNLELLSVAGDGNSQKRIPRQYLRASAPQRLALLQGLMDTDGTVNESGRQCSISTVLPELADGIMELIRSLGLRPTRSVDPASYVNDDGDRVHCRDAISVRFPAPPSPPLFRLQRKLNRQKERSHSWNGRAERRRIVAVEPVDQVPVRCITVDSPNRLYLAGRSMIPTHNSFPGGHLGIVGANAPSKLRARPRRVVLFDDVDAFPASSGDEGDPIELGVKRTSTFWNSKVGIVSTPTISDLSRIEKAYDQTDRSQYWVPCPHCEHTQTLEFENLKWETDEEGDEKEHHPDTARYLCEGCGTLIHERHKPMMLQEGEWRARDDDPRQRGFHLNDLYSPWVEWETIVREFLEAKGHPEKLQVFVNTRLGEPFDEKGQQLDADPLLRRREEYPTEPLPEGVTLLTAGVDVQADRLECEIVGWGSGEESWSIDYYRIPGDPSVGDVWKDLDRVLGQRFAHPRGVKLPVSATCVDSGYMTQEVYKYCGDRQNARVWAIKGMDGMGKPIMDRPRRNTRKKVPLYPVGVDAAKTAIYKRLQIEEHGDGYCHFPRRDPYDEEYFRQLTSEKLVRKTGRRGQQKLQWVRRPNRRAEALDVRVYAMAALEGLQAAGVSLNPQDRRSRRRGRRVRSEGIE